MVLKKFPEIKDWALNIMSNTLQFETELPYELGLIKQTSLFLKKEIKLKTVKNQLYWGVLMADYTIIIVDRLEGFHKIQTVGHEIGHTLIFRHNDLYSTEKDPKEKPKLINKETGGEFTKSWHIKLEKEARKCNPTPELPFQSQSVVEILCDEIGIYFTQRINKFDNLECYKEICPDQLLLFSDDVLKALKK